MPLYEHTFLTRHNLTPQQATGLADRFGEVIAEGGGRLVDQEYWGLRSLAYRIRNNRKAHFCFLRTDAPAAAVREMERRMRINEDVLRVLTVRVNKHDEGATPIMRAKPSRDARRPRRRSEDESERPPNRPTPQSTGGVPGDVSAASAPPVSAPDTPPTEPSPLEAGALPPVVESASPAIAPSADSPPSSPLSDPVTPTPPTPASESEATAPTVPMSEPEPMAAAAPAAPAEDDGTSAPTSNPNPEAADAAADSGEDK